MVVPVHPRRVVRWVPRGWWPQGWGELGSTHGCPNGGWRECPGGLGARRKAGSGLNQARIKAGDVINAARLGSVGRRWPTTPLSPRRGGCRRSPWAGGRPEVGALQGTGRRLRGGERDGAAVSPPRGMLPRHQTTAPAGERPIQPWHRRPRQVPARGRGCRGRIRPRRPQKLPRPRCGAELGLAVFWGRIRPLLYGMCHGFRAGPRTKPRHPRRSQSGFGVPGEVGTLPTRPT